MDPLCPLPHQSVLAEAGQSFELCLSGLCYFPVFLADLVLCHPDLSDDALHVAGESKWGHSFDEVYDLLLLGKSGSGSGVVWVA